jgi:hypothetical protein
MAATPGHRLTLDPMGKCSNGFFSETTNMIKAKLYMNVHWKLGKEHSNDHSWAVWFQLSKWFQRRSILKHFSHRVQCIIGRSSTQFLYFYADRKFKMAATAGHRLTLDPTGKCSKCEKFTDNGRQTTDAK